MSNTKLVMDPERLKRWIEQEGQYDSVEAGLPIRSASDIVAAVEERKRRSKLSGTDESAAEPGPKA